MNSHKRCARLGIDLLRSHIEGSSSHQKAVSKVFPSLFIGFHDEFKCKDGHGSRDTCN